MNSKTILITGASSGIGKDAARRLADRGHTVYVAARRLEQMLDLTEVGCRPLMMDLTKEEEIDSVASTILDAHGGLDVLFNNAGYGLYGAVEDIAMEEVHYQFDVNLFGLARLTKKFLPSMRERGRGTIINNSSVGGKIYTPMGAWYHATKHALEGWSDCLRIELAPFGVNVVVIEPGAIRTEFGEVMAGPMRERSGEGPYGPMVKKLADLQEREYQDGGGSDPRVVSEAVIHAVESSRPRTRYAVGRYAKVLPWIRRWFGDRAFDQVLLMMLK
ncbi:MAG: oxidoreductase [Verrucomicrobiota bacterium]